MNTNKNIKWICPICQSTEYKEMQIMSQIDDLGFSTRTYYECSNCSIHFGDLEKFNTISIINDVADELIDECLKTGG